MKAFLEVLSILFLSVVGLAFILLIPFLWVLMLAGFIGVLLYVGILEALKKKDEP
jgi:hypothetical protein